MSALTRFTARRVMSRIRGGSSSPVVVETEAGTFLAKLRGAGHGAAALLAEVLVAELAERLGLPVPERALIELEADVESDDRNDELADLLGMSVGTNLGLRWLEGAKEPRAADLSRLDDDFVARVLWLDGLVMNPDRTASNPNILFWNGQPWLIDHGAALVFQHDWDSVTEDSPREPMDYAEHVFGDRLSSMAARDERLAARLGREALAAAVDVIPDELIAASDPRESAQQVRARFHAFLWKRLKAPRPWLTWSAS